jgi:glycerol uptake facilitator protein
MSEYTLFEKCVTEFLSSVFFIFLGNGVIANELLSRTKGHAVGYGFVSVGFGFAIGFTIAMFGYCSANLNPAGVICGWLKGTINGVEVVPLILSELLGAFTGALLVYLTYLPHYMVVPELE